MIDIMLSDAFFIVMVSVIMPNVVMLSVVAPHKLPKCTASLDFNKNYYLNQKTVTRVEVTDSAKHCSLSIKIYNTLSHPLSLSHTHTHTHTFIYIVSVMLN
jgi:hypothetical protein